MSQYFQNDIDVLNYALTLEHLEAEFYRQAVTSGKLQGDVLNSFMTIKSHEEAHVTGLTQAISNAGGTPVKARASYDFSVLGDTGSQEGLLKIAGTLEPVGVQAYDGAAPDIQNKDYLATAGSIVQVEARHAAVIRALMDPYTSPVPNAFEGTLTPQEVLDKVTPILGPEQ